MQDRRIGRIEPASHHVVEMRLEGGRQRLHRRDFGMVLPCKVIVFTYLVVQKTGEPMTAAAPTKALINLRVSEDDRELIDRAASALGKNRSEFMLEASRRAAEHALLDRTLFRLDAERFVGFRSLLDAPPAPNEALARLICTPAPWET